MKSLATLLLLVVATLAVSGWAGEDFEAFTTEGKRVRLASKRAVFFFADSQCPFSRSYGQRLRHLYAKFSPEKVAFWVVLSQPGATAEEAQLLATDLGISVYLDSEQQIAGRAGITNLGGVLITDNRGDRRYRGPIDDNLQEERVTSPYAEDVLTKIVRNEPGRAFEIEFKSCPLEALASPVAASEKSNAYFRESILPLFHQHCASCHRPNQAAPFSILSYRDIAKKRWAILNAISDQSMPPWKARHDHLFKGERALSINEIETLSGWLESMPRVDDSANVPPPSFPETWQLGEPDLILTPETGYRVVAEGADEYRCFVLDPKFTVDKYVTAVEYRPGAPEVVHHAITYIDSTGIFSVLKDRATPGPGYSSLGTGPGFPPYGDLGGWAMGALPEFLEPGTARKVPRGSKLVLEVHYHKNGKAVQDQTRIGLYFAKDPVVRLAKSKPVMNFVLNIPAGERKATGRSRWVIPQDIRVLSVGPHMHLLGKKITMEARLPTGETKSLIEIDDWDFRWQENYTYRNPIALPKGTEISVDCEFDNSENNRRNPNSPPRAVHFGESTTDEMCVGYVTYTSE